MSEDRKARLAALAAKAGRNQQPASIVEEKSNESKPSLSFRNYVPKDASLDASAPVQGAGGEASSTSTNQHTPKRQKIGNDEEEAPTKSALEQALAKTDRESREAAGQNVGASGTWSKVTPIVSTKKINWDLKRDIQKKMDKLERRTQKAIVELLRERLKKEAMESAGDGDEDSDLD